MSHAHGCLIAAAMNVIAYSTINYLKSQFAGIKNLVFNVFCPFRNSHLKDVLISASLLAKGAISHHFVTIGICLVVFEMGQSHTLEYRWCNEIVNSPSSMIKIPDHSYFPDQQRLDELIDSAPQALRPIYQKLLQNMNHVAFPTFLQRIKTIAKALDNLASEYGVVLNHEDSKKWVWSLIKEDIKKQPQMTVDISNSDTVMQALRNSTISNFLIVDDAIYSGSQMASNIKQILLSVARARQGKPQELTFVLAVPFMTQSGKQKILGLKGKYPNLNSVVKIEISEPSIIIRTTKEILSLEEIKALQNVNDIYGSEFFLNSALTYFDHRLPDLQSFNVILHQLFRKIPKPYGRP